MLRVLALSAALAGATVQVDLPELFAGELPRVTARTGVPVLLPQRMPVDEDLERHTSGFGRERRWGLELASLPDCGSATACFTASFSGRRGGRPSGRRAVRLTGGRTGRFTPLSCGASCAPPRIEWRMRGSTYAIQAVVGTRRTERRILVRMANSAIRSGPR
jgi:hypothetical protein